MPLLLLLLCPLIPPLSAADLRLREG